ncbi:hypothetical protein BS17DRAFT_779509 [Gyrodon lividus]|nr:hypothetical protein BS17DRAFT_779509 [Gyrodon lividus]
MDLASFSLRLSEFCTWRDRNRFVEIVNLKSKPVSSLSSKTKASCEGWPGARSASLGGDTILLSISISHYGLFKPEFGKDWLSGLLEL